MPNHEHRRKRRRKTRAGRTRRESFFASTTLSEETGFAVRRRAEETGRSISSVISESVDRDFSRELKEPSVDQLITDLARTHRRLGEACRRLAEEGASVSRPSLLEGEGIGDAILRRQKTLG